MATDKFVTKENLEDVFEALREKNFPEFSTTETRVGTWINGKPLYRKVYTGTVNTYTDSYLRRMISASLSGTSNYIVLRSGGTIYGTRANGVRYELPLHFGVIIRNGYQWQTTLVKPAPGTGEYTLQFCSRADMGAQYVFLGMDYEIWIEYIKTTD